MSERLTPNEDRECPIYGKIIDGELCYETALCMARFFKTSSVPELNQAGIEVTDELREKCGTCPHSNME